jgi:hypothetical protein
MDSVIKAKGNMNEQFDLQVTPEEHRNAIEFVHATYYGGKFTS